MMAPFFRCIIAGKTIWESFTRDRLFTSINAFICTMQLSNMARNHNDEIFQDLFVRNILKSLCIVI